MGCGMSTEEKEGKARNEEIENQLKKDRLMQRNEIKMLLLGKFAPSKANPTSLNPIQVPVNQANQPSSSK
jgi:hypothetical protein